MKKSTITKMLACTIGLLACQSAHAISITLGGPIGTFREATLDSAVSGTGVTGAGNATAAIVSTYYASTFTERGSVAPASGSGLGVFANGSLSINVTSGSFGSSVAGGTWTISDPSFWVNYAVGAISLHVGGGQGSPDHFVWQLTPNLLNGTWTYNGSAFNGGGLSNLKLYSAGRGTNVPDGGATMALLGLSLLGMTAARKAMSQSKV